MPKPDIKDIVLIAGGVVGCKFFAHLLASKDNGHCRITGVVPAGRDDNENLELRRTAEAANVTVYEVPADILTAPEIWLGFSVGNNLILTEDVLSAPQNGFINFHAAPLPRFRGSAAPAFAIVEGVKEFGVTFHKMVAELDAGPILLRHSFPIDVDSTARDVDAQCIDVGSTCFRDNLQDFIALSFDEITNDVDRPAYRRSQIEAYRKLDMSWPKEKIWQHVRACDWDGVLQPAYFEIDGRNIFLTTSARGSWL